MICGVVVTSISGCGVCTVCRVVCDWVTERLTFYVLYKRVYLLVKRILTRYVLWQESRVTKYFGQNGRAGANCGGTSVPYVIRI
jgi:hypothetical protein